MDKRNQNMYLSELFLESLDGDFSRHSVLRALKKCEKEMRKRMGVRSCFGRLFDNFFNGGKQKRKLSKNVRWELMDFWDVYGEFDSMFRPSMKKNYLLLQMLRHMELSEDF